MPIDLIASAFDLIVGQGLELAKDKAKRSERILKVLNAIGLKQDAPPANDFDGVYAYTMVVYGIDKPKPILEFFRHEFIKSAFRKSFEKRDSSILEEETENFLDWNEIGKDILAIDYDPRREFTAFREQFITAAKLTRTVQDVLVDHKLEEIGDSIDALPSIEDFRQELQPIAKGIEEIRLERQKTLLRFPHQLPPPPADFIGRKNEIKQILHQVETQKRAKIIGIFGMGGIGKTSLGLAVAHELAEKYPDGQIFLDLKGKSNPISVEDIFQHIINSIEPSEDLDESSTEQLSSSLQSTLHGKRILLLLDNALNADQVTSILLPDSCAMLITSRTQFTIPGMKIYRLSGMSERDAVNFLLELCDHIGKHATELAKACAYLPLALRIAGSFLQINTDWSVKTYLAQLNDHKTRLAMLENSYRQGGLSSELDILATFELSYQQVGEIDQRYWKTLSVFPGSFDGFAVAYLLGITGEQAHELLNRLIRYGLLEYNRLGKSPDSIITSSYSKDVQELRLMGMLNPFTIGLEDEDPYQFHDLLHEFASNKLGEEEKNNVLLMHSKRGKSYSLKRDGDRDLSMSDLIPDLMPKLRPRAFKAYRESIKLSRELGDRLAEHDGLLHIGMSYAKIGKIKSAFRYFKKALDVAIDINNIDAQAYTLRNYGDVYLSLDNVKRALLYYKKALVLAQSIDHIGAKVYLYEKFGTIYYEAKDYEQAKHFYQMELEILHNNQAWKQEAKILGYTGWIYLDLHQVEKALETFQESLEYAEKAQGNLRLSKAGALGNLGYAYKVSGDIEKAKALLEQSIKIYDDAYEDCMYEADISSAETVSKWSSEVRKWLEELNQKNF